MDDLLNGQVSEENWVQSSFMMTVSFSELEEVILFNLQVENPSSPILHGCASFLELHLDANASCFISGKMISKMAYNNK